MGPDAQAAAICWVVRTELRRGSCGRLRAPLYFSHAAARPPHPCHPPATRDQRDCTRHPRVLPPRHPAGTNLYGSVTPADIVEALQSSPFRKLGVRDRNVRFPLSAAAAAAEAASGGAPPPADGDALRAIKVVGDHVVEIEARPGLWCAFTLTVGSS